MQSVLRQATPRSNSSRSRDGTASSNTPATRVVRIKPLE
jgi:hypothetical protein